MNVYANFYTDLGFVLLAIISGIYKWKQADRVGKLIFTTMVWYFFTQLITEGGLLYKDIGINRFTAFYYSVRGLQPLVEFILCVTFFHFAVEKLRQRKIALYLIPAGTIFFIACAVIFKNAENFAIYFAPLVNLTNMLLAILSLYYLQNAYELRCLVRLPVFWFSVLLLFFYGGLFFFAISYPVLIKNRETELFAIYIIFRITDVYYAGAAITYFLYGKNVARIG